MVNINQIERINRQCKFQIKINLIIAYHAIYSPSKRSGDRRTGVTGELRSEWMSISVEAWVNSFQLDTKTISKKSIDSLLCVLNATDMRKDKIKCKSSIGKYYNAYVDYYWVVSWILINKVKELSLIYTVWRQKSRKIKCQNGRTTKRSTFIEYVARDDNSLHLINTSWFPWQKKTLEKTFKQGMKTSLTRRFLVGHSKNGF